MIKLKTIFQIGISLFIIFLTLSVFYLCGFIKGYTSNNTKHEFIFGLNADTQMIMDSFNNMTYRLSPSNHSCLEGCYYLWNRYKPSETTIMINGITQYDCDKYCKLEV